MSNTNLPYRRGAAAVDWASGYFAALENGALTVTKAAGIAGVNVSTVYRRRKNDPAFAAREKEAAESLIVTLEDEAIRRAGEGVKRTRYNAKGQVISEEHVYSDLILLRLLERADPSFRTKQTLDVHSTNSGPKVYMSAAELKADFEKALKAQSEYQARSNDCG